MRASIQMDWGICNEDKRVSYEMILTEL